MDAKQALDELFAGVKFDTALYKKIVKNNIDFITSTSEHKELFGSKLIGCYHLSYTMYNKNIFYENLFDMDTEDVIAAIAKITTIPKNFKIARDDINLSTFYIAHRFLSNADLSKDKRFEYATEILNYFSYRTLVLISSDYWTYPITENKAVSLAERLSYKYIIKKVKNWNEFCQYRSEEYLKSRMVDILIPFNKDKELPNAITDLYNRTKEVMKNIYGEFIDMMEEDDILRSSKNVVTDIEGKEVLMDRTESPSLYIDKVEQLLVDKHSFVKRDVLEVAVSVIDTISLRQLEEFLGLTYDYYFTDRKTALEVRNAITGFLVNSFQYLQASNIPLSGRGNVMKVVNSVTGNLLYSRGADADISKVKSDVEQLVRRIYKKSKVVVGDRSIMGVRNGFCLYVLLLAIL